MSSGDEGLFFFLGVIVSGVIVGLTALVIGVAVVGELKTEACKLGYAERTISNSGQTEWKWVEPVKYAENLVDKD